MALFLAINGPGKIHFPIFWLPLILANLLGGRGGRPYRGNRHIRLTKDVTAEDAQHYRAPPSIGAWCWRDPGDIPDSTDVVVKVLRCPERKIPMMLKWPQADLFKENAPCQTRPDQVHVSQFCHHPRQVVPAGPSENGMLKQAVLVTEKKIRNTMPPPSRQILQ